MRRFFFNTHAVVITFLMIVLAVIVARLPLNVAFLNLLSEALVDFEISDVVMSQLRESREPDTTIVLVNIGHLPKQGIAAEIERLSAFQPKVIGLDVFPLFPNPYHPEYDTLFMEMLARHQNIVLASKVIGWNEEKRFYDSLAKAPPQFSRRAHSGFVNMIINENKPYRAVRECSPLERVRLGDTTELSLAAKIVQLYNPAAYQHLRQRGNDKEAINFRGNLQSFYALDIADVLDSAADLSVVRGKIVLLGYLGEDLSQPTQAVEDRFFTPLNERYIGKADRDMYGAVIHANIISMMLREDYINEMPEWLKNLVALVFCYLFVALLEFFDERFQRFYEIASLVLQLVLAIAVLLVTLGFFVYFRYDANLSLVLLIVAIAPNTVEIYLTFVPTLLGRFFKRGSRTKKTELPDP